VGERVMPGFEDSPTPAFLDLEKARREQRAERDAAIKQRRDRDNLGIAKLRATGVMAADDLLFRNIATTAAAATPEAPAQTGEMTRTEAYARLRNGGSREGVPEQFCQDFARTVELLGDPSRW
jgi:hypothetical protein